MGRLFWKVFGFTLLAQTIASLGIGLAVWLYHTRDAGKDEQIDQSPPAAFMIEAAATALRYGGVDALRELLARHEGRHEIVVQDESMPAIPNIDNTHDLLGHEIKPEAVAEARKLLHQGERRVVREVSAPDGHRYLLFSPMSHGLENLVHGEPGPPGGMGRAGPPPAFPDNGQGPGGEPQGHQGSQRGGVALHPNTPGTMEPGMGREGAMGPPPERDAGFFHVLPFVPLLPLLPVFSAILGSLIFSAIMAWYLSKPIRSLRSAFESVAGGDLEVRPGSVMGERRDELADLSREFDVMVQRLRTLMGGQKRLLHDVSHELRSPLARLQMAIGLARQQPDKIDASLERIERESVRMDKLVGELLTLSKLEAGALKPAMDEMSVEELLLDLLDDARFEAAAHEVKFECVGNKAVTIRGDAVLLHSAIENVLRNAIKQTVAGSTVILEVNPEAASGALRILVLDRGPGVLEEELDAIFGAFFRGSSAAGKMDGHGLGLAIAQRVVAAHGGSIVASNRQGGGLIVEIRLPLMRSAIH
ncbi:MAG TPA: ATP-binding protein [Burkholderiaceae bacterium]